MNNLRSVNIADPNLMALDPDTINIEASIILEKPHLQRILTGGGQLIAGHYQFAYYLQEVSGGITSYSPASNSIFITEHVPDGGTHYNNYMGVPVDTQTGVSIEIEVGNVNISFTILNFIVIKKLAENASPIIELIQVPIGTTPTVRYTYNGNANASTITEIDFTAFRNTFDICHTIAQKDNILFAANTIGDLFDVDIDTRAYRFNAAQGHDLRNDDGTPISITSQELLDISEPFELDNTSDAINNDQYFYKYQYTLDANGNPVIGGQGPNISYKFTNRVTHTDDRSVTVVEVYPFRLPYPIGASTESLGTGVDYQRDFYKDHKSPYTNHMFRGYRRGEKYRFAWVPIKNGIEGYARWIADIQMPEIYEDIFTSNDPDQETFITGDTDNTYQLGVEFRVTIPSDVALKIDSYRIKRVKLKSNDRTILGQGIIQQTAKKDGIHNPILGEATLRQNEVARSANDENFYVRWGVYDNFTLNIPVQDLGSQQILDISVEPADVWNEDSDGMLRSNEVCVFHSPEFLFGKTIDYRSGDKIKCIAGLTQSEGGIGNRGSTNYTNRNVFWKLDNLVPLPGTMQNREFEVKDALTVAKWNDEPFLFDGGSYTFENRTRKYSNVLSFDDRKSEGSYTNVIVLDKGIPIIENEVGGSEPNGYNTSISNGTLFSNTGWLAGDEIRTWWFGNIAPPDVEGDEYYQIGQVDEDDERVLFDQHAKIATRPDKILANYIRQVTNQYGGASYSARANNIYINTGTEISLANGVFTRTFKVYGGDTFVNVFDTFKMLKNYDNPEARNPTTRAAVGLWYPLESFVNLDMRHGVTLQNINSPAGSLAGLGEGVPNTEDYPIDTKGEDFGDFYNYVYSEEMDLQRSFPLPLSLLNIDLIFPTRIWASNVKVYGEQTDSWRMFDSEKYLDIQGNLGEIRQLVTNNNILYAWQENGFGVVSVNERALTSDQAGSGVILGKSGVLPRFDYISEAVGSWHQFSFAVSPVGILFFDKKDAGLYLFTSQGLRDVSQGKINAWLHENTRGLILQSDAPIGQVSKQEYLLHMIM